MFIRAVIFNIINLFPGLKLNLHLYLKQNLFVVFILNSKSLQVFNELIFSHNLLHTMKNTLN